MSTSWPCNMRGPQLKTLTFVLLLLLTALTRTGFCQDYDPDVPESDPPADEEEAINPESDGSEVDADTEATDQIPTEPGATTTVIPPAPEDLVESTIIEGEGSGHDPSLQDGGDPTEDPSLSGTAEPQEDEVDNGLNPIIILIPVALVVIIIPMIVCGIFINRRWNNKARDQEMKKEDPYLDESSTEKVPMPMFEEDVPSVLELEMEELDQWMKKDDDTAEDSKQA